MLLHLINTYTISDPYFIGVTKFDLRIINDRIFLLGEDGDTFVVKAGSEFELIRTNSLNEMALATPAVVRGSLILRTQSKLYRISNDASR